MAESYGVIPGHSCLQGSRGAMLDHFAQPEFENAVPASTQETTNVTRPTVETASTPCRAARTQVRCSAIKWPACFMMDIAKALSH